MWRLCQNLITTNQHFYHLAISDMILTWFEITYFLLFVVQNLRTTHIFWQYILVLFFLLISIKLNAQSSNSSVGNKFQTQCRLSWIAYLSRASIIISKSDFICKRTCSNYWIPWQKWNMENLNHSSTFCGENF